MDQETRSAFARMDRYFELSQAQFLELSSKVTSLDDKVTSLDAKVTSLDDKVASLENQLRSFRDWTVGEFVAVRKDLSALGAWTESRLAGNS